MSEEPKKRRVRVRVKQRQRVSSRKRKFRFPLLKRDGSWSTPEPGTAPLGNKLLSALLFPWQILVSAFKALSRLLKYLLKGMRRSWRRRTGRLMFQSLPAVITIGTAIWLAIAIRGARGELSGQYQFEAAKAFAQGDYHAARLYHERLVDMDGGSSRTRYELALSLAQTGQKNRALAIMSQLAPADSTGYPQAHLWMADHLLLQPGAFGSREVVDAGYAHLKRAHDAMPDSVQSNLRMSQYMTALNRYDEAIEYMSHACKFDPKLNFELAMLLSSRNRAEEADEAFAAARSIYESELRIDAGNQQARLRLASIQVNLGEFDEATDLLEEGEKLHPQGPFTQSLAFVHLTRFDKLQREGSGNAAEQLQLLQLALQRDPNSREVLTRMMELGGSSEQDAKATKQVLETLLASGYVNAFVHFVLGCKSWEAREPDAAIFHFEQAYKLDSSLGPVANNLAWTLSHGEGEPSKEQLERALQLIESVLKQWPNQPVYRDTRGQVLVKLERWEEALTDLEFALPSLRDNADLHAALAITYEALGQRPLAIKHQQLATKLAQE